MAADTEKTGFYVNPKTNCPHIKDHTQAMMTQLAHIAGNGACGKCGHEKENWVCLECGGKFCSRYVKSHMVAHNKETSHPIAASYSDFSLWCYACDDYIKSPRFTPLLKAMAAAKFGDAGTGGRFTAHANAKQMEEIEEEKTELDKKISALTQMIRESKHMIVFTGAGISTSAGIPDYRGKQGVWTLKATGGKRTLPTVATLKAMPTPTHMALVELHNQGILKHVISQNVDGLHRRSGIHPKKLSELHGNTNLEVCTECKKEFMRDSQCHGAIRTHHTGRICSVEGCKGKLKDSIVNFGESLPINLVERGFDHASKADLCICMGSSLTVTPAANMPRLVGKNTKAKLVVINLQRTPLDSLCSLRIHGKVDYIMENVMKQLGLSIPSFVLERRLDISHTETDDGKRIVVRGVDVDGTPITLLRKLTAGDLKVRKPSEVDYEFFVDVEDDCEGVDFTFTFMGHYEEPELSIRYYPVDEEGRLRHLLSYNPLVGSWGWRYISDNPERGIDEEGEEEEEDKPIEDSILNLPKQIKDRRHNHALMLTESVYGGMYRCNSCMKPGQGAVYHCTACQYDLHPRCAVEN